jgi:hypothetical protein
LANPAKSQGIFRSPSGPRALQNRFDPTDRFLLGQRAARKRPLLRGSAALATPLQNARLPRLSAGACPRKALGHFGTFFGFGRSDGLPEPLSRAPSHPSPSTSTRRRDVPPNIGGLLRLS